MLVTNLLFLRGFTVIHRAFIRNYVMIFQDLINIFEVLERKVLLSDKNKQKALYLFTHRYCSRFTYPGA